MSDQIEKILSLLQDLQDQHELTLLKLSEPLLAAQASSPQTQQQDAAARVSDASSTGEGSSAHPTPASLDADLLHYKDLFSKLRFSYTSQVSKERFLRALVSDPPALVDSAANAELEASLADLKSSLQAQKASVDELLKDLENQARGLAERHVRLEEETARLADIPGEVERLRAEIARMREEQGLQGEGDGEMSLGLEATLDLVEEREGKLEMLDERLEGLVEQRGEKERELKRLREEVVRSEEARDKAVASAVEARRRRENGQGGIGDEVEERGRWLRGVESTMKSLLEVEG